MRVLFWPAVGFLVAASVFAQDGQPETLDVLAAQRNGVVSISVRSKGNLETLDLTARRLRAEPLVVVIPSGSYLTTASGSTDAAYWVRDSTTLVFRNTVDIARSLPVVKYMLKSPAPPPNADLTFHESPSSRVGGVLQAMEKDALATSARQLAAFVLGSPELSRKEIDSRYYFLNTGFGYSSSEAVQAEDPVRVFETFQGLQLPLDEFEIWREATSLVEALGAASDSVRKFALKELTRRGSLPAWYLERDDAVGALLFFAEHRERLLRYRAVRGLRDTHDPRICAIISPLRADDVVVLSRPGVMGRGSTIDMTVAKSAQALLQTNGCR